MAINPQILSLLQTAGQSLYDADQVLQATVTQYGEAVNASMKANPFDLANDARFEEFKTIARLAKAVAQIEDELKKVYGVASVLTTHKALSIAKATAIALPAFTAPADLEVLHPLDATDVIDKRQSKKPVKRAHRGSLSATAINLLAAVQKKLTLKNFTKVNRAKLALETGLPYSSIVASFTKLKELGYIEEGARGQFRLVQKPPLK